MKFLELYIDSVIMWTAFYFIGRMLFENNNKLNRINVVMCVLIFALPLTLLNYYNTEVLNGIIKIICVYCLFCLYYKYIFKNSWAQVLVASLILYLCLCVSEVTIALFASIIFNLLNLSLELLKNTIIINLLIALLELTIIKITKNILVQLVKNSNFNKKSSIIIITTILITLALLIFKIPVNKWKLDAEFIITMIILLSFCIVGLILIKQQSDIKNTMSKYQHLVKYSDITNKVLEDYRMVSHEHKNQLSIIRGMVDNKNQELLDYLDKLIEKRNSIKYQWVGILNYLPLSGLRGLINYKLIEMENLKLNKSIYISPDISKIKLNNLSTSQKDNLYSIIGVYLDNAIYAANQTKEKELSLEIFKEKNELVFILANSYSNKIDIDKIDNYGYTTKGKNHGVGLFIVQKILEEESIFYQKRKLFDNYYVQELRIDLNKVKRNN